MTREEAITAVQNAFDQIAGEWCVGLAEEESCRQECLEVLAALGVTDEELRGVG